MRTAFSGAVVVEVVVVVRIAKDMIRIFLVGGLHRREQVFDTADISRGQRIQGDHGVKRSAVTAGNTLGGPLLDGVVGADLQPLLDLVVSIDLSGQ